MTKKRWAQPQACPDIEPPPDLERILCDLVSPDDSTRANAVRELCPCRGAQWGVPVFQRVIEMRSDPSPVVRHAVQHDLEENPDWNERQEARRLEGLRLRQETERVRQEIQVGLAEDEHPAPHSLAWRMPRRPRVRKRYYRP